MKALLPKNTSFTRNLARRSAFFLPLAIASLSSTGCVKAYPYEHFVFLGEFEVTEYGKPNKAMITGESEFAVEYRLDRPAYTVYIGIDINAYVPTAAFWAIGRNDEILILTGTSIPCRAPFRNLQENHFLRESYPRATLRLQWEPTEFGPCKNLPPAEPTRRHTVSLQVIASSDEVFKEDVEFKIARNGVHWVIDAI